MVELFGVVVDYYCCSMKLFIVFVVVSRCVSCCFVWCCVVDLCLLGVCFVVHCWLVVFGVVVCLVAICVWLLCVVNSSGVGLVLFVMLLAASILVRLVLQGGVLLWWEL